MVVIRPSALSEDDVWGLWGTLGLPPRPVKPFGEVTAHDERHPVRHDIVGRGVREAEAWPRQDLTGYLMAWGLMGEPVPRLMTSGGAQKKNSYTPSAAQSSARSFR